MRAIGRALDLGINCFDTAEGYGMGASERALGQALGSRRDEAIVVTKFGMNYRDKPNFRDSSRERVIASIDKSLKNLGTDYVDVYLVHWPDRLTPFEETMSALDDIVRAGKVRFVGLSNFKRDEIEACMAVRRVDVVQYGWNMFDRRMQREILPYCEEQGIGFMAYGSLAFGLLTGTFTEDMDFGRTDWRRAPGQYGLDQDVRDALRSGEVPRQRPRCRRAEGDRGALRQEPSAARAALGDLAPGRQHRARRLSHCRRGRGQRRRGRLVDHRRRPRRDRRDLRPPRRQHRARLLDRRGMTTHEPQAHA